MKRTIFIVVISIFLIAGLKVNSQDITEESLKKMRYSMVETQIVNRGIVDNKVIEAMKRVPRHLFVLPESISQAYNDYPLRIGYGQTISQPYIVAFMTDALNLKGNERILEIGTGSGYQAAVLGEICDSVYTIEIVEPLGEKANVLLQKLGYNNVAVKTGDGYKGWVEHAPYDAIIVTCSPTHVPEPLISQLADNGKMIIPVGESYAQELVLLEKKKGKLVEKCVLPIRFVPMMTPEGEKY